MGATLSSETRLRVSEREFPREKIGLSEEKLSSFDRQLIVSTMPSFKRRCRFSEREFLEKKRGSFAGCYGSFGETIRLFEGR
jgi:hypothetical protein